MPLCMEAHLALVNKSSHVGAVDSNEDAELLDTSHGALDNLAHM